MSNGAQKNVVPKNPRDPETGMTAKEPKPKYTLMARIPIPNNTDVEDGDIVLSDRLSGSGDNIVVNDDTKEQAKKSPAKKSPTKKSPKKSPTKQPSQPAGACRQATQPENSSTGSTEDDGSTSQAKPKYTLMAKVPIPDNAEDDEDGIVLSDRLSGPGDKIVVIDDITDDGIILSDRLSGLGDKSDDVSDDGITRRDKVVVIDDIREHAKKSPTKQPSQPSGSPATKPENSSTGGTEDDGSTSQEKPKYTLMAKVPIPDTDDDDGIILSDRLSGV